MLHIKTYLSHFVKMFIFIFSVYFVLQNTVARGTHFFES
jgi:hypothetical protein